VKVEDPADGDSAFDAFRCSQAITARLWRMISAMVTFGQSE